VFGAPASFEAREAAPWRCSGDESSSCRFLLGCARHHYAPLGSDSIFTSLAAVRPSALHLAAASLWPPKTNGAGPSLSSSRRWLHYLTNAEGPPHEVTGLRELKSQIMRRAHLQPAAGPFRRCHLGPDARRETLCAVLEVIKRKIAAARGARTARTSA
jgi:hypothetical protein